MIRQLRCSNTLQRADSAKRKVMAQQSSTVPQGGCRAGLVGNGHTGRGTKKQACAVSEHFNINILRQENVLSGQVLDTLQLLGLPQQFMKKRRKKKRISRVPSNRN